MFLANNKLNSIKKILLKNKRWIIILIGIIILRFLLSFKLPSFYLKNLRYDDRLMVNLSSYLLKGRYLGNYCDLTLVKGVIYPFFLAVLRLIKIPYSISLTILYIVACLFFTYGLMKTIKNKTILTIIFTFLLFNPISYSSDVFQRLYRNSILYIELLFFLGIVIIIIYDEKEKILNYIFLGIIISIMLLTKEDTISSYFVLLILLIYKMYKKRTKKNLIIISIPIVIIILNLNIVSFANYLKYNIYTYDELRSSNFKKAYKKILQIKDDQKIDNVAIPKSTLYKLAENSKVFDFTKRQIDNRYNLVVEKDQEVTNGNIVWYIRSWIYQKNNFQDGKESEEYYKKLSDEIEKLFNEGKLEKEFALSSVFLNIPTLNEMKNIPKNLIKAIWYTTSYKNIKTFSEDNLRSEYKYDEKVKAYTVSYVDYHNAENLIKKNIIGIEFIKNIYKYLTIIFTFIALIIYFRNIKRNDKLNLIVHIIVVIYFLVIGGIAYTHTTAFSAIRYCYLNSIYILQELFILLNLYRLYINCKEKVKELNDIKLLGSGEELLETKISVIIPAYNEEKTIGTTIDEIIKVIKCSNIHQGSEIIVVNDGSTDHTHNNAVEKGVIVLDNPQNMGYGYSLKKGIEKAKNETIVITDADLTYPFTSIPEMLKKKKNGFDLIVGARTGKFYKESIMKNLLRKILKIFVEFVSGKKIKDINSGLRIFDKSTVMKYFPRLCNTFSFTTSQTLAYLMNDLTVCYIDISYGKREGKSKIKLISDSAKSFRYILEAGIYYNPLKIFNFLTIICVILSIMGFIFSHFARIKVGYILGIGGLLVSIIIFALGILATLLKQIMDK